MRDASQLESDSVNDYINRISVDIGTSFYSRRSDGRVSRGDRMIYLAYLLGVVCGMILREWISRM